MVSFTCGYCQDVVKKPKVGGHAAVCGASFTCVDCMEVFDAHTVRHHTSCMTEAEKYQGKWQRRKHTAPQRNNNNNSEEEDGGSARQPLRPPRPAMDLSSSSDDDDDWVTSRKKTEVTRETKLKRCRDEVNNNDNENKNHNNKNNEGGGGGESRTARRLGCDPLELPRAVTAADCIVPSFVLGTDDEVAEVARWVIEELAGADEGAGKRGGVGLRLLARKVAERYNARIAKHVRQAIATAVRNGKLREEDGVVVAP